MIREFQQFERDGHSFAFTGNGNTESSQISRLKNLAFLVDVKGSYLDLGSREKDYFQVGCFQ